MASALSFRSAVAGPSFVAAPRVAARTSFSLQVMAGRPVSPPVTHRKSEKNALYNKAWKNQVATRTKKVISMSEELITAGSADVAALEAEISAAFKAIDKAAIKGVLHDNTAARRKARLSAAKKRVLAAAGALP